MSIFYTLLLTIITLFLVTPTSAATRLGLHVTQEELYCWRQRAGLNAQGSNGITCPQKYKVPGDVSVNSPGDWNRLLTLVSTFTANPIAELWEGQTAAGPWLPNGHVCTVTHGSNDTGSCTPTRGQGQWAAAAGFVTLLDTTKDYSAQFRTLMLDQVDEPGTNWNNTAKWQNAAIGDGWSGSILYWIQRLAYAYDYFRIAKPNTFSASEKVTIETWFSDAAFYWARNSHLSILDSGVFPNRMTEFPTTVDVGSVYTTDNSGNNPGTPGTGENYITHYDCVNNTRGHMGTFGMWQDRSAAHIQAVATAAMLTSGINTNTVTKDGQSQRWVKMYFKEWLTYAVFSDSMTFDSSYWWGAPNTPTNGWQYSSEMIGSMVTVADLFARAGDTSLYDFSTSAGKVWSSNPSGYNANTNGGPKSLHTVMSRHASFVNQRATGVPGWTGSDDTTAASTGGPHCGADRVNYLIQPNDVPFGEQRIDDTRYVHGNVYYRDTAVQQAYTRTLSGAPAYPVSPAGNANAYPWGGPWWTFPGVLFMFGQMEGLVNPYSTSAPPLNPPQNLRLISF